MLLSLLTETNRRDHISPIHDFWHWLHVKSRIGFKIIPFTDKYFKGQAASYLKELTAPYYSSKSLCSHDAGLGCLKIEHQPGPLVVKLLTCETIFQFHFGGQTPLLHSRMGFTALIYDKAPPYAAIGLECSGTFHDALSSSNLFLILHSCHPNNTWY